MTTENGVRPARTRFLDALDETFGTQGYVADRSPGTSLDLALELGRPILQSRVSVRT